MRHALYNQHVAQVPATIPDGRQGSSVAIASRPCHDKRLTFQDVTRHLRRSCSDFSFALLSAVCFGRVDDLKVETSRLESTRYRCNRAGDALGGAANR